MEEQNRFKAMIAGIFASGARFEQEVIVQGCTLDEFEDMPGTNQTNFVDAVKRHSVTTADGGIFMLDCDNLDLCVVEFINKQ